MRPSDPPGQGPGAAGASFLVTVAGTGRSFPVQPGERLLAAGRRAGVWLPFECGWGSCGTCKVTLVEGEVDLLFPEAPAVDARDERRHRTLTCQTTALSDLVLEVRPPRPLVAPEERPTEDHLATLSEVTELGPDIARFRFSLERPARFRPGQYAVIEPAPGLRRCYSMSSGPGSTEVEFIAKHYAGRPGSGALFGLSRGGVVPLEMPYGDMWLRPGADRIVLIAGGTGVSPVLAILGQLAALQHPGEVEVLFGANTRPELVAWDELDELVGSLPRARLHGALLEAPPGWRGSAGLVTDRLAELLDGTERCYLAGPPPMVDATLAVLRAAGVSLARIHYDRFG